MATYVIGFVIVVLGFAGLATALAGRERACARCGGCGPAED